jgi:type III secretory pathway component EscV
MKIAGFLLLLSGWGIVVAALALLRGSPLTTFIFLGIAVEILGLVLIARAHLPASEGNG